MGWLFSVKWPTKAKMVEHLTAPGDHTKTIAKAVKGNTLWTVMEVTKAWNETYPVGHRAILCFLLESHRGEGWGYKDMDESMGPVEISCPVKFLDMVPDPGGYATAWRAKVRAAATRRVARVAFGDRLWT